METEFKVEGSHHRVAGRDLYQINNFNRGRPLTREERREINARVDALCREYGDIPWSTWRAIHRAVGVNGIDELTVEHKDQVGFILDLLEERGDLKRQLRAQVEPPANPSPPIFVIGSKPMSVRKLVQQFPRQTGVVALVGILLGAILI